MGFIKRNRLNKRVGNSKENIHIREKAHLEIQKVVDSSAPLVSTAEHSISRSKRSDCCRSAQPNPLSSVHLCAAGLEPVPNLSRRHTKLCIPPLDRLLPGDRTLRRTRVSVSPRLKRRIPEVKSATATRNP